MLLIRWSIGNDVQEIGFALHAFKADSQIAAYNAHDSEDAIGIIEQWLNASKPQLLYIGSHGNSKGLKPTRREYPELTWSRLAAALQKSTQKFWVCIGACDSAFAAHAWAKQQDDFPVSVLIGFQSDRTNEEEVENSLLNVLEVTGFYSAGSPGNRQARESITTIGDDTGSLQSISNRVIVLRRNAESGEYEARHSVYINSRSRCLFRYT